jgi:hypothetical protein
MNLSKAAKVTRVSNAVAAGTTAINSSSVDMKGFEAVEFTVAFGAITAAAVTSVKLQGSRDNVDWTSADLEGTSQTVADDADNKIFRIDVAKPRYRYLRCVVSRATQNAAVDSIVAMQYQADKEPITQDTTVGGAEFHHAPERGTA